MLFVLNMFMIWSKLFSIQPCSIMCLDFFFYNLFIAHNCNYTQQQKNKYQHISFIITFNFNIKDIQRSYASKRTLMTTMNRTFSNNIWAIKQPCTLQRSAEFTFNFHQLLYRYYLETSKKIPVNRKDIIFN